MARKITCWIGRKQVPAVKLVQQNLTFATVSGASVMAVSSAGKVISSGPWLTGGWFHGRSTKQSYAVYRPYFEIAVDEFMYRDPKELAIGVAIAGTVNGASAGEGGRYQYFGSGQKRYDSIYSAYGIPFTKGDVIGCSMIEDGLSIKLCFYVNGVSQGVITTSLYYANAMEPHVSVYQMAVTGIKSVSFPSIYKYLPEGCNPW